MVDITAAEVYRDFVTDGVPSSGKNDPHKRDIRKLLKQYETIIAAFTSNGGVIYASKAALDADLARPANTMAWVLGDAVAANNGIYRKVGASGAGNWVRAGDLPYSFILASNVGDGTPSAIQATTSVPVSGSSFITLPIVSTNLASPVTVSFNGGSPLLVVSASGAPIKEGDLRADMIVSGFISGSRFQLTMEMGAKFVTATNVGGTNAILASTEYPIPTGDGSALVILPVLAANNASPVTVRFNAGPILTIKTNSGHDIAIGGLTAGMLLLGMVSGNTFRLISDQVSAAIIAIAEDAAQRAENAQAAAESAAAGVSLPPAVASTYLRQRDDLGGYEPMTKIELARDIDPAEASQLGFVADGWINIAFTSANKQIMSRTAHTAKTVLSSLAVIFANWWVDTSYTEVGSGGDATITASIEYPVGVFTQITFGGSVSTVIPDGDQIVCDHVAVDIPEGATFWVRSFYQNDAGILFRGQLNPAHFGYAEFAASGVTDKTMGGSITNSSGGGGAAYMPLAIVGETDKPSVLLIGDSRVAGTGDTMDETVFVGNLHRSVGEYAGCCVLARGGDRADKFIASHAKRFVLSAYADVVVIATGINDLTAGRSAAQLQADVQTINGYFPDQRVFNCTIEPVSDSTDGYITIANQTPRSGANNAGRNTFNAAVRSGLSGADGYFELADAVEYKRQGVWKVTYGIPHTADGAHATQYGYQVERDSGVVNQFRIEKALLRKRLASVGAARRGRSRQGIMSPYLVRQSIRYMSDIETWTPVAEGLTSPGAGTYSVQAGSFRLFGDICFINFDIFWTAHTGAGNLVIKGLPFVPKASAPLSLTAGSLTYTNQLVAYAASVNRIDLFAQATGASLAAIPMDTSARIWGSGWYFIDISNAERFP